jgi:hypothetical protein
MILIKHADMILVVFNALHFEKTIQKQTTGQKHITTQKQVTLLKNTAVQKHITTREKESDYI